MGCLPHWCRQESGLLSGLKFVARRTEAKKGQSAFELADLLIARTPAPMFW
jgi:hypothetical protein